MVSILGPDGQPIQREVLREPQTARIGQLHHEFQGHPSRGLTPTRLARILEGAEQGDILAQCELFEDMEEKDGHVAAEMGKRRRAVSMLDWDVTPPPGATAAEKEHAARLKDLLPEIPEFEEVLYDITDAVGKGYACLEIEWHRLDGLWLPKAITHRPQGWFQLYRGFRQEIRLRDNSADGQPLLPFGWITHTHRAKSGYLERAGLFRVLVWPYLFKNYSVADLAEFLEIYGIPLRLGKYPSGAGEKEKAALLRALVNVGHNAAGIVPSGMEIDFHDAATGDPDAFELMIDWCERTESKVILGATLTSQADRGSNTNALGNVHDEVRKDLRDDDAKKVASTVTRDLLYPIAALNGWAPSLRRAPRFVLDTSEAEDIQGYAEALPALVNIGFRIRRQWAQEQLGIPEPEADDDVLHPAPAAPAYGPGPAPPARAEPPPLRAAARAQLRPRTDEQAIADRLGDEADPLIEGWLARIEDALTEAGDLATFRARLDTDFAELPTEQLTALIAQALLTAELGGRASVQDEVDAERDA